MMVWRTWNLKQNRRHNGTKTNWHYWPAGGVHFTRSDKFLTVNHWSAGAFRHKHAVNNKVHIDDSLWLLHVSPHRVHEPSASERQCKCAVGPHWSSVFISGEARHTCCHLVGKDGRAAQFSDWMCNSPSSMWQQSHPDPSNYDTLTSTVHLASEGDLSQVNKEAPFQNITEGRRCVRTNILLC